MQKLFVPFMASLLFIVTTSEKCTQPKMASDATVSKHQSDCHIIRKIMIIHCKRGPGNCDKCDAVKDNKYSLLDICPEGEMARRMIEIKTETGKTMVEFETIQVFDSKAEAKAYAEANNITNVEW